MKRSWRHQLDEKRARRRRRYRRVLLLAAAASVGAGAAASGAIQRMNMRWLYQEQGLELEWIPLQGSWPGEESADKEVCGIRICPDTLEIQFYRRQQTIRGH